MNTVLLFTPTYPPDSGGAATFYSTLTTSLSDKYRFLVVSSYQRGKPLVSDNEAGRVYRILPRFERLPTPLRVSFELVVLFLTTVILALFCGVEVVHAHASTFAVLGLAAGATLTRKPLIYDCRDKEFRHWMVTLGPAVRWFSCSPSIDEVLKELGIPRELIVRVPIVNPGYVDEYGTDIKEKTGALDPENRTSTDQLDLDGETSTSLDLIYVGMLRPEKGIYELIDAFAKFVEEYPEATLTVVGSGPAATELRRRTEQYSLDEVVRLPGQLNHRKTLQQIADADILVHPSRVETGPRTVIEAMEIGTPVVSTSTGIVPEVVEHRETGMIVENSPDSIASALIDLARNPTLRREMATLAQCQIKDRDWEIVDQRVREAYSATTNPAT